MVYWLHIVLAWELVLTQVNGQLDGIYNHPLDKPLGRSVRDYLD